MVMYVIDNEILWFYFIDGEKKGDGFCIVFFYNI